MNDKKINPVATPNGIRTGNRVVGWSCAVRQFDSSYFDHRTQDGFRWQLCIQEAKEAGWIQFPVSKEIILCRWLVATVFINEERDKNGTVDVPNEDGGFDRAVIFLGERGGMSIYPGPVRFAMSSHIESVAIEKYGREEGLALALRMYRGMVEFQQEKGFALTAFGREAMDRLHNGFIAQLQTEGVPGVPLMH